MTEAFKILIGEDAPTDPSFQVATYIRASNAGIHPSETHRRQS
jgi:hypothetical protein